MVRKLNIYLKCTGQKELGFDEFESPDQTWLARVARYIDSTNLLEIFEAPAKQEPDLNPNSCRIARIYFGRLFTSEYLFRKKELKENRKLWESLKLASEAYRSWVASEMTIQVLKYDLSQAERRKGMLESDMNELLYKASITYSYLDNPEMKGDQVLSGGDSLSPAERETLSMNFKM